MIQGGRTDMPWQSLISDLMSLAVQYSELFVFNVCATVTDCYD